MNTSSRTFPHRIMALLLSIIMALSLLTIPPRSVQAGMMPSSLVSALGKVALSAVQSSVGWGLCELSDVTQNDTMASAFSYTRALIVGRQRVLTEQNIELVQELAASLDALYDYTVQSSNDISTMIKNLTWKSAKDTFDKNAGIPIDNFTSDFKNIGGYFNDLINAYAAYCDDPSEDHRSDLETLYFKVYGTYFLSRDYDDLTDQVNTLFKVPMLGDSTHTGFLSLISPYDYTQPIESTADMCDPDSDSWVLRGGASTDTTYLGYYRTYITQVTNFQNNVYDSMVDAAALVDTPRTCTCRHTVPIASSRPCSMPVTQACPRETCACGRRCSGTTSTTSRTS